MGNRWMDVVLNTSSSTQVWQRIFDELRSKASEDISPDALHNELIIPDRFLAESAWELWNDYIDSAPRTSVALKDWWHSSTNSAYGKAILILDALSLRELPILIKASQKYGVNISEIKVTGSEVPSATDSFAKALGLPSRSALKDNRPPASFAFAGQSIFTDVVNMPFEDAIGNIEPMPNLFIWHHFIDNALHEENQKNPEQLYKQAVKMLEEEGFWQFINALRRGRELVITADHGYATSKLFGNEETASEIVDALKRIFGAKRYTPKIVIWENHFMPPLVLTTNSHHVVIGQRKWKVQGGFPNLTHGGLSLLEVAVPFIKLPAI